MKNLFSVLVFALLFVSYSCGDDDPVNNTPENCSTAFTESFEDDLTAVNTASTNYANDPSSSNCEAFKDAYNNYLDALEDWEECAVFYNQVTQWQQSLDAARTAVNGIAC